MPERIKGFEDLDPSKFPGAEDVPKKDSPEKPPEEKPDAALGESEPSIENPSESEREKVAQELEAELNKKGDRREGRRKSKPSKQASAESESAPLSVAEKPASVETKPSPEKIQPAAQKKQDSPERAARLRPLEKGEWTAKRGSAYSGFLTREEFELAAKDRRDEAAANRKKMSEKPTVEETVAAVIDSDPEGVEKRLTERLREGANDPVDRFDMYLRNREKFMVTVGDQTAENSGGRVAKAIRQRLEEWQKKGGATVSDIDNLRKFFENDTEATERYLEMIESPKFIAQYNVRPEATKVQKPIEKPIEKPARPPAPPMEKTPVIEEVPEQGQPVEEPFLPTRAPEEVKETPTAVETPKPKKEKKPTSRTRPAAAAPQGSVSIPGDLNEPWPKADLLNTNWTDGSMNVTKSWSFSPDIPRVGVSEADEEAETAAPVKLPDAKRLEQIRGELADLKGKVRQAEKSNDERRGPALEKKIYELENEQRGIKLSAEKEPEPGSLPETSTTPKISKTAETPASSGGAPLSEKAGFGAKSVEKAAVKEKTPRKRTSKLSPEELSQGSREISTITAAALAEAPYIKDQKDAVEFVGKHFMPFLEVVGAPTEEGVVSKLFGKAKFAESSLAEKKYIAARAKEMHALLSDIHEKFGSEVANPAFERQTAWVDQGLGRFLEIEPVAGKKKKEATPVPPPAPVPAPVPPMPVAVPPVVPPTPAVVPTVPPTPAQGVAPVIGNSQEKKGWKKTAGRVASYLGIGALAGFLGFGLGSNKKHGDVGYGGNLVPPPTNNVDTNAFKKMENPGVSTNWDKKISTNAPAALEAKPASKVEYRPPTITGAETRKSYAEQQKTLSESSRWFVDLKRQATSELERVRTGEDAREFVSTYSRILASELVKPSHQILYDRYMRGPSGEVSKHVEKKFTATDEDMVAAVAKYLKEQFATLGEKHKRDFRKEVEFMHREELHHHEVAEAMLKNLYAAEKLHDRDVAAQKALLIEYNRPKK